MSASRKYGGYAVLEEILSFAVQETINLEIKAKPVVSALHHVAQLGPLGTKQGS